MDANDAASYVQNLAGENANIIFGAMYDDSVSDAAKITVIATGLDDATTRQASVVGENKGKKTGAQPSASDQKKTASAGTSGFQMPKFNIPNAGTASAAAPQPQAPLISNVPKKDIQIPEFLRNRK